MSRAARVLWDCGQTNKTHWCGKIATEFTLSCLIMSLWLCPFRKGKWEKRDMHSTAMTLGRGKGSPKERNVELLQRYGLCFRGQNLYKRPLFKSRLWAVHIGAPDEFLTLRCRLLVLLRWELGAIFYFNQCVCVLQARNSFTLFNAIQYVRMWVMVILCDTFN